MKEQLHPEISTDLGRAAVQLCGDRWTTVRNSFWLGWTLFWLSCPQTVRWRHLNAHPRWTRPGIPTWRCRYIERRSRSGWRGTATPGDHPIGELITKSWSGVGKRRVLTAEHSAGSDDLDDAVSAFLALALVDVGREREAVSLALEALSRHLAGISDRWPTTRDKFQIEMAATRR